jgi:NAD(P) transhydrogenase subunit alpha
METTILILLIFLLILAVFLGLEVFSKTPTPAQLPLLSGSNAVSGATVLGAILMAGLAEKVGNNDLAALLGGVAVALAMVNMVGGYLLTDHLLEKSRKKDGK